MRKKCAKRKVGGLTALYRDDKMIKADTKPFFNVQKMLYSWRTIK